MKPIIYDNQGASFDRYTVIYDGAVYAMSDDPLDPMGVNQFSCTQAEFKMEKSDPLLGARVKLAGLPERVQFAIKERMAEN